MCSSDINNSSQLKLLTHPEPFQDYGFHAYLVESTKGDLLHFIRNYALIDGFFKHNNRRALRFTSACSTMKMDLLGTRLS